MLRYRNFTQYLGTRPRWQLFDLMADPTEGTNLASNPAYQGVLQTLQADIRAWQLETNDYWTIKYIHE